MSSIQSAQICPTYCNIKTTYTPALFPVYYQNYILGELCASQLKRYIVANLGGLVDNPKAGRFMAEQVFRPGAVRHWDEALEHATGERLNPRYFVEEFVEGG